MAISIDHRHAEEVLLAAYRSECAKDDKITKGIKNVLSGTHKTYKYILVNGILAKAACEEANPIALQAGAPLKGAFDARSLCHKVLVPFERDFLKKALGGSNEPFLNKPARFTHLSEDNAVRKGKDKQTLLLLIEIFNSIKTSDDAKKYLSCVLEYLKKQIEKNNIDFVGSFDYSPDLVEIYEFSIKFIKQSFEGETSAVIVGTLEGLLHEYMDGNYRVISHKINQSGASSKEVGDIDVYRDSSFFYSIEVKDKDFTEYDVEHAFNKVMENGGEKAAFVYGNGVKFDIVQIRKIVKKYERKGMFVVVQDISTHIKNILFRLPVCTKNDFLKNLSITVESMNCKRETINWMTSLLQELKWGA